MRFRCSKGILIFPDVRTSRLSFPQPTCGAELATYDVKLS